mgnify:CR=1 FL=1
MAFTLFGGGISRGPGLLRVEELGKALRQPRHLAFGCDPDMPLHLRSLAGQCRTVDTDVASELDTVRLLLVQTAAILGNYLPMRAGTALRFHYFKVVHKVDYSLFGGLSAVRMVLLILATSFASLLGLIATEHEFSRTLWLLYGGLAAIGISLLVGIRYVRFSPTSRLGAISIRFVEGFASIGRHPWEACATLGLIFVQFSLLGVRMAICFAIIGQSISPSSLLLIVPIATLLSFLTITPGNLGLREWTIGAVSLAAGLDLSTGVFAATLDRAILVALTFAIGGPSLWWTLIKIRHARKSAN